MVDRSASWVWGMRGLFLAMCLGLIFWKLLPLTRTTPLWLAPDLMLALTLAWTLRRPELVPPLLVAGVFFLADLLFQRPPGLWAALVLIGALWLRRRVRVLREMSFTLEWLLIAICIAAMTVSYRIVLAIAVVDQPQLALSLQRMVITILSYPAVVMLSRVVLGVRKSAPGEVDALGHRL